eukprot:775801_1
MNPNGLAFALSDCIIREDHFIPSPFKQLANHIIMDLQQLNDNELSFEPECESPCKSPKSGNHKSKKKIPNIIKRNKSVKYNKIPRGKSQSSFGTAALDRNEIIESSLPGPGNYCANTSTFKSTKSPKSKTTFGVSTKEIAKEVIKSKKLGPGAYDPSVKPSKPVVKGGSWNKAVRRVTTAIDVKNKTNPGPGEYNAIQTEQSVFTKAESAQFDTAQFDWKLYRKQYHDIVLNRNNTKNGIKSPKSPAYASTASHISSKFRTLSLSPTHNKNGSNHFGVSPRFNQKSTNPVNLSSFKGSVGGSVKEIFA